MGKLPGGRSKSCFRESVLPRRRQPLPGHYIHGQHGLGIPICRGRRRMMMVLLFNSFAPLI